jgi:hypothetical protein
MSSPDYKIKEILAIYRSKTSINQDTNIRLELSNKTNFVKPDKEVFILNAIDQFNLERNESDCYRISGRLDLLTDDWLESSYCYGSEPPTDFDWDPIFLDSGSQQYGNRKVGKNWVLQITYPSKKDRLSELKSQKFVNGVEFNRQSRAYEGIQIESITPININGRRDKVLLRTVQRHGIEEIGEDIYIKSKETLDYLGFHKVVDFEIGNEDRGLILDTPYEIVPNLSDNFLMNRVLDISFNDFNFNEPSQVFFIEPTDENGQNIGQIEYIKLTSEDHGLRVGSWVDVRIDGPSVLNGLFKVVGTPNKDEFLIFVFNPPINTLTDVTNLNLRYRLIDGTPSEYYYRKFEILTELNDYEVYRAAYATNIFNYGVTNNTNLFHFNKDINVKDLTDNLGRPISRLYLTMTRRSSYGGGGLGYSGWSDVISLLEENRTVLPNNNNTPYNLDTLSFWQSNDPLTTGTISRPNVGDEYFGDFVEYNELTLSEKVLSKVINRFSVVRIVNNNPNAWDGGDNEGYYYQQHYEIKVREFSDVVENVLNKPDEIFPFWAQINNDGTVSWRDLLSIGFFEGTTKGVDYPFVNGCNYLYDNYSIYIRRQRPIFREDNKLNESKFISPGKISGRGLGDEC